jgi:hypothetical protein
MSKFSDSGKISASGREFIMESVFLENDWKRHMSVNLDTGLWQDFKSGEKGNFISLYAYVENMTYQQAQVRLLIKNFDSIKFEDTLNLSSTKDIKNESLDSIIEISADMSFSNDQEFRAWTYLNSRCLFDLEGFKKYFISSNKRFSGRVIIPFEKDGFMYYFQARTLTDQKPKYLNPTYYNNLRVSDVLYPFDEDAEYLVVCEGPIDAISLQIQGVNATSTQGCHVSRNQVEALRGFRGKIIVGFDNDTAGQGGRESFNILRKSLMMKTLWQCSPPKGHKDWNSAHMKFEDLTSWISANAKPMDDYFFIQEMMKYIG